MDTTGRSRSRYAEDWRTYATRGSYFPSSKMNRTNPKVDWFFDKPGKWQEAYTKLRTIVLGCGLTEDLKWGCPCYTFEKSNIVLIHGFKEYCALLFFKGA